MKTLIFLFVTSCCFSQSIVLSVDFKNTKKEILNNITNQKGFELAENRENELTFRGGMLFGEKLSLSIFQFQNDTLKNAFFYFKHSKHHGEHVEKIINSVSNLFKKEQTGDIWRLNKLKIQIDRDLFSETSIKEVGLMFYKQKQ
jgi:hypothetical protein